MALCSSIADCSCDPCSTSLTTFTFVLQVALVKLQVLQARVMQLEVRFNMKGLMGMIKIPIDTTIHFLSKTFLSNGASSNSKPDAVLCLETVEGKYRSRYEADPFINSMKGVGREGLWQAKS